MLIDDLQTLLDRYHPTYEEEKLYKEGMLNFLKKHPDCFKRTCLEGHFTASAWLLNQDETKVLLLHHAKLNQWFQLGGHCDGDPDVLAVAIKESREESGINRIIAVKKNIFDLDIHKIPRYKEIPEHFHYDIRFLLKVDSNEKAIQNKESKELRWFGKDKSKLPTNNKSIIRMFDKWLNMSNP